MPQQQPGYDMLPPYDDAYAAAAYAGVAGGGGAYGVEGGADAANGQAHPAGGDGMMG